MKTLLKVKSEIQWMKGGLEKQRESQHSAPRCINVTDSIVRLIELHRDYLRFRRGLINP